MIFVEVSDTCRKAQLSPPFAFPDVIRDPHRGARTLAFCQTFHPMIMVPGSETGEANWEKVSGSEYQLRSPQMVQGTLTLETCRHGRFGPAHRLQLPARHACFRYGWPGVGRPGRTLSRLYLTMSPPWLTSAAATATKSRQNSRRPSSRQFRSHMGPSKR